MPTLTPTPHAEQHFEFSATLRDIVVGMADGVPFALAPGISDAAPGMGIVVTAWGRGWRLAQPLSSRA